MAQGEGSSLDPGRTAGKASLMRSACKHSGASLRDNVLHAHKALGSSIAALALRPNGAEGLLLGLPIAIDLARAEGLVEMAGVYRALGELVGAVAAEMNEVIAGE